MASTRPTRYRADYYYQKLSSQHLEGATTESAVPKYLRKKHAGYEITLMSLEWM